jgi:4-cresol dehydrogenase (hydroxylating)
VDDTSALAALVDAIQPLVLEGTIAAHAFGLWNAYLLLAKDARYPWRAMKDATPLVLRAIGGKEPWSASGALYAATAAQRVSGRKRVQAALKRLPVEPAFWTLDGSVEAGADDLCLGTPTQAHLAAMYWRKRSADVHVSGFDPHRDRCGVIWIHVSVPFTGEHVVRAAGLLESTIAAHGLEPMVGMTCATGRLVNLYTALVYDREAPGEDERAMTCHDELLARLAKEGYPPYRLGIQSMSWTSGGDPAYAALLRRLKAAFDPNDILAPGRYEER